MCNKSKYILFPLILLYLLRSLLEYSRRDPVKRKYLISLFIAFAIFLFFPKDIQAARSMTIVSDKLSLLGDEEMVITASPSGFIDGETIYVKGAFYQDSSSPNYFGYTKKGDLWIKNSQTTTDQLSVKMGEWNNILSTKTDFLDSGYKGEGDYQFKAGFYYTTSSGNSSSVQWSNNILTININEPDPTPTLIPSPTPEPTEAPQPTNVPTLPPPSPIPTSKPIATPKPTSTPKPTLTPLPTMEEILGTTVSGEIEMSATPTEVSVNMSESKKKDIYKFLPFVLIIPGAGMIGFAVFTLLKTKKVL